MTKEEKLKVIEEWREIPQDPRYEASNLGRIRRASNGRLRKIQDNGNGYKVFMVKVGKVNTNRSVHRCVLQAFYPINNYLDMEVNHKDFNPSNNALSNLEWVTNKENLLHAHNGGRMDEARKQHSERMKRLASEGKNWLMIAVAKDPSLSKKAAESRRKSYKKENHPFYGLTGRKAFGAKHSQAKVNEAHKLRAEGKSMLAISKIIGINYTTTRNMILNESVKDE